MARERQTKQDGRGGGGGRGKAATSIFPVCLALLRRRYISSRRKKFNVAVKADGNADCGLWASPVTVLHRTMHISQSGPSSFRPLSSVCRPPRSPREDTSSSRLALPRLLSGARDLGFRDAAPSDTVASRMWLLYHSYACHSPKNLPEICIRR